jgi:hypothetical protein
MIPSERIFDGQRYEMVGERPYIRRDGRETLVIVWRSHCAQCGAEFTISTPNSSRAKFMPNRRCQKHKRPGHRVKGGAAC